MQSPPGHFQHSPTVAIFHQRDVALLGQEVAQGFTVLHLCRRSGEVKRAVLVAMEVRVGALHDVLIGLMIRLVEPLG